MVSQNKFASAFRKSMRGCRQNGGQLTELQRVGEEVDPNRLIPQPFEVLAVEKNLRRVLEVRAVFEVRRPTVQDVNHLSRVEIQ